MIKQLKQIYPTLTVYNQNSQNALHTFSSDSSTDLESEYSEDYAWFLTDEKEIIGIHKNDLTKKDVHLLSTFLQPFHTTLPNKTVEEQQWHRRIHEVTN